MILSHDIIAQMVHRFLKEAGPICGIPDDWWFDSTLKQAAWAAPSALTGNQIGMLFALSPDRPFDVQVTVHPSSPNEAVLEGLKACDKVPGSALQALKQMLRGRLAELGRTRISVWERACVLRRRSFGFM